MNHETVKQDQKDRVLAYQHAYAITNDVVMQEAMKKPYKYAIKGLQMLKNSTSRIQAWEVDRMLGKPHKPGNSVRAITAGGLTPRDNMQIRAFHAFMPSELELRRMEDWQRIDAFTTAIVKTSDDAFDEIWGCEKRRAKFREWLQGNWCHSKVRKYDFGQHE